MRRVSINERSNWQQTADKNGFSFHTIDGQKYWDESAYYAFTRSQIEQDIKAPTVELHEMAMSLINEVAGSQQLMERLGIPDAQMDFVSHSWKIADPHLYGRMDFSYDGKGPAKLFEFNYDTPTSLYESATFQGLWLEEQQANGLLPKNAGQYNSIDRKSVV